MSIALYAIAVAILVVATIAELRLSRDEEADLSIVDFMYVVAVLTAGSGLAIDFIS